MSKTKDWFQGKNEKPFNKMIVLYWALGLGVVCGLFYFFVL